MYLCRGCNIIGISGQFYLSLVLRKPVFGVSDQVAHKPGCTATEDGLRLEISDLDRRVIALSMWQKQRR